jgi:serine-type D-Ala-D-Ala carboxypeptidase/endopeptidase (penicillin-binding protein 4)
MRKGIIVRATRLAFLFSVAAGGSAAQQASLPLQSQAQQIIGGASGEWGVVAWSIARGVPLIDIEGSRPLIPASNNKVFTAIWALDELGPEYRFNTDLLITGPVEGGTLRGDVVLRGSGDPAFGYPPNMGHDLFTEEPMTPLRNMARRLAQEGVRIVEGSVIGDATIFDSILVGPAWPNDTGAGAAQYAPRVSGLAFQRNMIWVEAGGAGLGAGAVRLDPPVDVVPVLVNLRAGGGQALAVRRPDEDTIRISGAVGRGGRYGVGVADPALMTTDAFRQALMEQGIQVRGEAKVGRTPENATLIHRNVSIPLAMMIPFLNQQSDNFFAEHLWKAAAAAAVGEGSYVRGGPASALHFIQHAGVEPGELYQFDGSGLSSYTRTTANALVKALVYAHGRPYSKMWHESLAVAADPGGTMTRMYRNTAAAGNLHAKTGYIRGVRTLSGYVTARNGDLIAFSFLYNGRNTNGARTVQQELGVLLADYAGR